VTHLGCLRFSTDARSAKIEEFALAASKTAGRAVVELCWFFPITREQYRLRCTVQLTYSPGAIEAACTRSAHPDGLRSLVRADSTSAELHAQFWRDHAPASRSLFELVCPGTHKKRDTQGDLDRFEPQPVDENRPSMNFVTVCLMPVRCDYLKLPRPLEDTRGQIQQVQHQHESQLQPSRVQMRWLHVFDEATRAWTATELNP
jgi:hypothetical protein